MWKIHTQWVLIAWVLISETSLALAAISSSFVAVPVMFFLP